MSTNELPRLTGRPSIATTPTSNAITHIVKFPILHCEICNRNEYPMVKIYRSTVKYTRTRFIISFSMVLKSEKAFGNYLLHTSWVIDHGFDYMTPAHITMVNAK